MEIQPIQPKAPPLAGFSRFPGKAVDKEAVFSSKNRDGWEIQKYFGKKGTQALCRVIY